MLAVDGATGSLTPIGHVPSGGRTPRHFALDPAGRWLLAANQDSDTVVAFGIDPASGQLAATGQVTRVPTPVCVLIAGPFG
jgi:6-phosphogluconolactonase